MDLSYYKRVFYSYKIGYKTLIFVLLATKCKISTGGSTGGCVNDEAAQEQNQEYR